MNGAPVILDTQLRPVAILDTASNICWELKHNDLNTAEFSLVHEDPRNDQCAAMTWVHMFDGPRDLGIFRIAGLPTGDEETGGTMTYSLDHVLALLLDKVIFGKLELTDMPFDDAIRRLLALQNVQQWALGACDFDTKVTLSCANETVLSAIQKACDLLKEEYTWTYDTSRLPFVLSIRKADEDNGCGIHHGRNKVGVQKQMDASTLVTRLYLLGGASTSGSQVTVETLTEGGVPYIDADTIGTWGIKEAIYQNGDLVTPETLMARGQAVLESYKNPFYTYTATALDLYQVTGYAWDMYEPGKKVLVMDDENGVHFSARIVTVSKQDSRADPGSITITIASKPRDELNNVTALAQMMQSVASSSIGNTAANFVVEDKLAGAKTEIKQNAEQILLRATKEEHDALTGRVTQAESSITVAAEGIALVSGRTTTLEGEMVETKAQIRVNNDSIGMLVTKTETIDGRVTDAEAELVIQADQIASKVSQGDYDTFVTQTSQAIELRATQSDLNALGNRVTTAEATLTVHAGEIAGKVSTGEFQTYTTQTDTAISLKADQGTVNSLGDRMTTAEAELQVQAGQISSKVSQGTYNTFVTQTNQAIELRALASDVETSLSVQDGKIAAKADRIELQGLVTADQLSAATAEIGNLKSGISSFSLLSASNTSIALLGATTASIATLSVGSSASLPNPTTFGSTSMAVRSFTVDGTHMGSFMGSKDINFKIADTQTYKDGVSAARNEGVESVKILSADITSEGSEAFYKSTKHIYVTVRAEATNGEYNTNRVVVDASDAFDAGAASVDTESYYNAGVASVTISASGIVRDRDDSYNSTTHNTSVRIKATASNGDNAFQNFTVSGASAYNAGASSVTCDSVSFAYEADGLYVTVNLSNGKSPTKKVSGY